jgi:hypothetical protein
MLSLKFLIFPKNISRKISSLGNFKTSSSFSAEAGNFSKKFFVLSVIYFQGVQLKYN